MDQPTAIFIKAKPSLQQATNKLQKQTVL